jgi:hypothetical protein
MNYPCATVQRFLTLFFGRGSEPTFSSSLGDLEFHCATCEIRRKKNKEIIVHLLDNGLQASGSLSSRLSKL